MGTKNYIVTGCSIRVGGKVYHPGDTAALTADEAGQVARFLEELPPDGEKKPAKTKGGN